jgi:hypothetical protein
MLSKMENKMMNIYETYWIWVGRLIFHLSFV